MRPKLFRHRIFKRIAALLVVVSMLSFGAPAWSFSGTFAGASGALGAFAAFAADETASLQWRHISFEYGYTECTGEVHPVSDIGVGVGENSDTPYPDYYTVTMMICDTGHVLRVLGDGVTEDNVTYESLDPAVLEVDNDGNVTLKKTGMARVEATVAADETYDESSKLLYVKVDRHEGWIDTVPFRYTDRPAVWGLDLDTSDGAHQLVVPLRPGAGVIYYTEDPSIVSIDQNGIVTPLSAGTTQIIMDIDDGGGRYTACRIGRTIKITGETVTPPVLPEKQSGLIDGAPVYYEGRPQDSGLDLDVSDGPQKLVLPLRPGAAAVCSTDNVNAAYVDDEGIVTPVAPGKTDLTISVDDGGGKYKESSITLEINVTDRAAEQAAAEQAEAEQAAAEAAAREAAARAAAQKAAQAAALKAEITKAKSLKKPALKVKALKRKRNKLTWGKVQNADGYIVYVKYPGKKKYVKAATRKANVKSVTHKGLTKGRVYRYKVRAYKVVNGKYYYGPFSRARKARVR